MANTPVPPATIPHTPLSTQTVLGKTVINDSVVAKVAGIAAREANGVHALGGGAARALGAIRGVIGNTDLSQGISVEVGETQVAVDVAIVAEYPVSLQQVVSAACSACTSAGETIIGMEVTEVNVTVNDVFIASEDNNDEPTEARVQ